MSIMQELVYADKTDEFEDGESQLNSDSNIVMNLWNVHWREKWNGYLVFERDLSQEGIDNVTESTIFVL